MKIGIIGAIEQEVEGLKAAMSGVRTEKISSVDFFCGKINGTDTVVAAAGVGKVNAAVCAETMILSFSPDTVINVGAAGGLSPKLGIGDIAIADAVAEHDMDTTAIGDAAGFISGLNTVYIECDKSVTALMERAAAAVGLKSLRGVIASGDQFISTDAQRGRIINTFGAIAAEMEGAAIGHVCAMNGVPFGVLRAISDSADSESKVDYPTFAALAAKNSVEIIKYMLGEIGDGKN